jgi:hypothetical protein
MVNRTKQLIILRDLQERANIRQFAARTAIDALALAPFGDRQYCREGSFCFSKPGIVISHKPNFSRGLFRNNYFHEYT